MSFEIKHNKIEVRIPSVYQSYNHGCEVEVDVVGQLLGVVENIVIKMYDTYSKIEGEYEFDEDFIPDYINSCLYDWVNYHPRERHQILYSYGLNRVFREVVEESGFEYINKNNVEEQLVYYIVYKLFREISNEFWKDITKAVIKIGYSSDIFEFVDC